MVDDSTEAVGKDENPLEGETPDVIAGDYLKNDHG